MVCLSMSNYVLAYQMRSQIISNFWNTSTDTRSVHLKLTKVKYWNKAVEKGGRGGEGGRHTPHHFLEQEIFFLVKSENVKFLHVNNMWDFSSMIKT